MYVDIIDLQSYTYQYKFNIILSLLPLIHNYSYTPQKYSFTSFPCHSLLPPPLSSSPSLSPSICISYYIFRLFLLLSVLTSNKKILHSKAWNSEIFKMRVGGGGDFRIFAKLLGTNIDKKTFENTTTKTP